MAQTIESIARALEMTPEREDAAARWLAEAIEEGMTEMSCTRCGDVVSISDGWVILECHPGGHIMGMLSP